MHDTNVLFHSQVTPIAFTSLHNYYFLVYAVINTLCIPIVYFFYPETAGRSLEEIDEIFAASKNIFDPVRVARNLPRRRLSQYLADEEKVDLGAGADGEEVEYAARDV